MIQPGPYIPLSLIVEYYDPNYDKMLYTAEYNTFAPQIISQNTMASITKFDNLTNLKRTQELILFLTDARKLAN